MDLSPRQRLALAEFLLESAEDAPDSVAEEAWEDEIQARIRAVDEGRTVGTSYEEVMRSAGNCLAT